MTSASGGASAGPIDCELVRRLVAAQFPHWRDHPIMSVASHGTDNAIFRVGAKLAARLPRRPEAAAARIEKEIVWLPRLAPHLPFAVPVPLAMGTPGEGYPFAWSVVRWLDGVHPDADRLVDADGLAADLALFLDALRAIDAADGPRPGAHNFGRGVPLVRRDAATRAAIAALSDEIDSCAAQQAWQRTLDTPLWSGAPVWIHGDLAAGNILLVGAQLHGVIDFGGLAVGDPACDLMIAWSLLSGYAREVFRVATGLDGASWQRGKGWALSWAVIALDHYRERNPPLAAAARRTLAAVLGDA